MEQTPFRCGASALTGLIQKCSKIKGFHAHVVRNIVKSW